MARRWWPISAIVLTLAACGAPEALPAPSFAAVDAITHSYDGDFNFYVGGGVAVLDCNDDRYPDLYLAGGESPAGLFVNQADGEISFSETEDPVGIEGVTGAYPLDIDSDGVLDLVVLRFGENVLFRGLGDCRFEPANDTWGFDGGDAWTTAFAAHWEDDGFPTMAFGNYLVVVDDENRRQDWSCEDNVVVPGRTGGFGSPTPLSPSHCTLSLLWTDWARNGTVDLRVSNDRHYYVDGQEQLWTFETGGPTEYAPSDGWKRLEIWGMGIASHDVTGDGLPDYVLTSQGDNKLQTLSDGADRPLYTDIAIRRGTTAHRPHAGDDVLPSTAWHPEFGDVNADGLVDLFLAKGNVEAEPDHATDDPNNLLLGQPDGTFVEGSAEAGIVHMGKTRGAALVDLDLDGRLDIVEVNRAAPVRIWRNEGNTGRWLQVWLSHPGPNPNAVGARLEIRDGETTWTLDHEIGGGHAGDQQGWIHVGVGSARTVEARVTWPDGSVGPWIETRTDRYVELSPAGELVEWSP